MPCPRCIEVFETAATAARELATFRPDLCAGIDIDAITHQLVTLAGRVRMAVRQREAV